MFAANQVFKTYQGYIKLRLYLYWKNRDGINATYKFYLQLKIKFCILLILLANRWNSKPAVVYWRVLSG